MTKNQHLTFSELIGSGIAGFEHSLNALENTIEINLQAPLNAFTEFSLTVQQRQKMLEFVSERSSDKQPFDCLRLHEIQHSQLVSNGHIPESIELVSSKFFSWLYFDGDLQRVPWAFERNRMREVIQNVELEDETFPKTYAFKLWEISRIQVYNDPCAAYFDYIFFQHHGAWNFLGKSDYEFLLTRQKETPLGIYWLFNKNDPYLAQYSEKYGFGREYINQLFSSHSFRMLRNPLFLSGLIEYATIVCASDAEARRLIEALLARLDLRSSIFTNIICLAEQAADTEAVNEQLKYIHKSSLLGLDLKSECFSLKKYFSEDSFARYSPAYISGVQYPSAYLGYSSVLHTDESIVRDAAKGSINYRAKEKKVDVAVGFVGALGLSEDARTLRLALEQNTTDSFELINVPGVLGQICDVKVPNAKLAVLCGDPLTIVRQAAFTNVRATFQKVGIFCPWEFPLVPRCYIDFLSEFDHIWVPSRFVRDTLSNYGLNAKILPLITEIPKNFAPPEKSKQFFTFLTVFDVDSSLERKNIFGIIESFKLAFPRSESQVRLLIKVPRRTNPGVSRLLTDAIGDDIRISVRDEYLPRQEFLQFIAEAHCLVSLHRAEGFGRVIAEAMGLKVPVIATAYSGNMDFCTSSNSLLVDFDLVEVGDGQYHISLPGAVWASPKIDSCVAQLRWAFYNYELLNEATENAYQYFNNCLSFSALRDRYSAEIKRALDGI